MRSHLPVCTLFAVVLSGCAAPRFTEEVVWHKPGATQAMLDGDSHRCNAIAWRQVPAYQPPQHPTTQFRTNCTAIGSSVDCDTYALDGGPRLSAGSALTVANEKAQVARVRNSAFIACMYERGWSRETIVHDHSPVKTPTARPAPSALAPGEVGAGCSRNSECNAGLYCHAQMAMCVGHRRDGGIRPGESGASCRSDADCNSDNYCARGTGLCALRTPIRYESKGSSADAALCYRAAYHSDAVAREEARRELSGRGVACDGGRVRGK